MTLDEYQKEIYWRSLGLPNVSQPNPPEDMTREERYDLVEEMAEVLVFVARWAEVLNTDLSAIANHSIDKLKMASEFNVGWFKSEQG